MPMQPLYVIDGGNTQLKLGVFVDHQLIQSFRLNSFNDLDQHLSPQDNVVVANVGNLPLQHRLITLGCQIFQVSPTLPLPFTQSYKTPQTLGIDRLCNIVAVHQWNPKKNVLVIDAGTCIKCDFIDHNGIYLGGSISPGLLLRYRSLHEHTALLPNLMPTLTWDLIGNSSENSIHSGVMAGTNAEILWRISEFNNRYEDLVIYLTGGDAQYFDLGQKKPIFVDENLTLKGIYALHLFQNSL
jgi:type III pantothenate kinase